MVSKNIVVNYFNEPYEHGVTAAINYLCFIGAPAEGLEQGSHRTMQRSAINCNVDL